MPRGYPLDDTVRAAVLADIQARQLGRNAIARKHSVGLGVVSSIALDAGITDAFDRSHTARATADRRTDLQARRTVMAEDALDDADRLRDRFFDRYGIVVAGPKGAETVWLDLPDAAALRNFVTAWAVLIDKHLALDKHDSGLGHDDAKSMLVALSEGLRAFQQAKDAE